MAEKGVEEQVLAMERLHIYITRATSLIHKLIALLIFSLQ